MRVEHVFCDHCKREIGLGSGFKVLDLSFCLDNPDAQYPDPLSISLSEEVCSISCAMALITNAIETRPRGGK